MKRCPICEGAPSGSFDSKFLKVLKCGNGDCGHLYAAAAPPQFGVQQQLDPAAKQARYMERNSRLVRYWSRAGLLNGNSKVLDFGAGSGHISMALRDVLGVDRITCVEANTDSVTWLRRCGLEVKTDLDACSTDYDAILLVELIEHVDDPVSLLRALRSRIALDGQLFISTPGGELRSGSRRTSAYDTREHIHFFTERSLELALERAGFKRGDWLSVPEMYPRKTGPTGYIRSRAGDMLRAVDARLRGPSHLITLARPIRPC